MAKSDFSNKVSIRSKVSPSTRVSIVCGGGRTRTSFKDECDINVIMRRFQASGILTSRNPRAPQYIDATGADFGAAMNLIAGARSMFNGLPASLRAQFNNDPRKLLEFAEDPANRDKLAKMGLKVAGAQEEAPPEGGSNPPSKAAPAAPEASPGASG